MVVWAGWPFFERGVASIVRRSLNMFTLIALGTGKKDDDGKLIPFEVKVGDKVLVSKYGGTEVKIGDDKYSLLREDDILGVIG